MNIFDIYTIIINIYYFNDPNILSSAARKMKNDTYFQTVFMVLGGLDVIIFYCELQ